MLEGLSVCLSCDAIDYSAKKCPRGVKVTSIKLPLNCTLIFSSYWLSGVKQTLTFGINLIGYG